MNAATSTKSNWTRGFVYALALGFACLMTYLAATKILDGRVATRDDYLSGMWATVGTVFVLRETMAETLAALRSRLIATATSSTLCFGYLFLFPFSPLGLAAIIALGAIALQALDHPEVISVAGITTSVVMVSAAQSPTTPWLQPGLRMVDTLVGMFVGAAVAWLVYGKECRRLYTRLVRRLGRGAQRMS